MVNVIVVNKLEHLGDVEKLVYSTDLKSVGSRHVGSSPTVPTNS